MQTSMNHFLKPEMLWSQNKWFCPSYRDFSRSTTETFIINSARILIIQFGQFSNQGVSLSKDANFFSCTESEWNKHIEVPITVEDEVSFTNNYSVIATVNHWGTLNRGSLLAFCQGPTLIFLVLLLWQIGFNLKKVLLTILHYTSFFTAKFKCSPGSTKNFHGFARGFCHLRHCVLV